MFRSDWSIKPNGQAYLDLVFGDWWTDEDLTADATAKHGAGIKGDYEFSATFGEYAASVATTLSDGGLQLQLAHAVLAR